MGTPTFTVLNRMSTSLGQAFVVDNRPGAGGNIGTAAAAHAAADGYTLLMSTSGPLAANKALYRELPYDPLKDLAPIGLFATLPSSIGFVKSGKLRALMVTDRMRSSAAPEIPSAKEADLGEMVLLTWNGVLAPAGTPAAVLDHVHKDVVAVMNTAEMKERMLVYAYEVSTCSREDFARIIRDDLAKWTKLIKASGLRSAK